MRAGVAGDLPIPTEERALDEVIDCYKNFDKREPGWIKVALTTSPKVIRKAA